MLYELTQRFYFEAAHTLDRRIESEPSRRIHGHTYHAEIAVRAQPDPDSGMVMDLGHLRRALAPIRESLDHHLLDKVPDLTHPTLEGLCTYIARKLQPDVPGLAWVRVWREASGDACRLDLPSVSPDVPSTAAHQPPAGLVAAGQQRRRDAAQGGPSGDHGGSLLE
jgi:6-pyruvoyltetrahydropterin/6-carboxytetrahydropterin synthase